MLPFLLGSDPKRFCQTVVSPTLGSKRREEGRLDIVRFLALKAHANVNQARTDDGSTPSYIAAQEGHLKIIRFLIQAGADMNPARTNGWTALTGASHYGHVEFCGRLLIAGAIAQPRDFQGYR